MSSNKSSKIFHPVAHHHSSDEIFTGWNILAQLVTPVVSQLGHSFKNYRQRRIDRAAFQHLLKLDDTLLRDIGVSRQDVKWADNLPLSQNASLELEIRAITNKSNSSWRN